MGSTAGGGALDLTPVVGDQHPALDKLPRSERRSDGAHCLATSGKYMNHTEYAECVLPSQRHPKVTSSVVIPVSPGKKGAYHDIKVAPNGDIYLTDGAKVLKLTPA